MNKSGNENRSVRNTKKRLRGALLSLMKAKPISQISAKELTELADVNRGTFYFHYSDVFDMLRCIEDEFFKEFDSMLESAVKSDEAAMVQLEHMAKYISENPDFCKIMLSEHGDIAFLEKLKERVNEKCSYFWRRTVGPVDERKLELYNSFILLGCVGMIKSWIDGGFAETPAEIADFAAAFIRSSLLGIFGKEQPAT